MTTRRVPPPPTATEDRGIWGVWHTQVKDTINSIGSSYPWTSLDFTGSNLTDLQTRNHNDLLNSQGGDSTNKYHLTTAQHTAVNNGITVVITTAKLTVAGVNGSMTFTNGILTAQTQAT